ncbi:MAG: precorrin-2 C(20)-methyltransferase [Rhodospirillaceae bacterium]
MSPTARPVLSGVGVGPGDPELLTIKALRIIAEADRLAYPANAEGHSLALSIVQPHLAGLGPKAGADIVLPMRFLPGGGPEHPAYDTGAAEIRRALEAGQSVAFLCEGDPLFYGSFIQILDRLQASGDGPLPPYEVAVVPGVNAMAACAALVPHPLVTWEESLSVIPATLPEAALRARLDGVDAAVIMKLGRHLPKVAALLRDAGLADGAMVVVRAGLEGQAVLSLPEALEVGVPYFSLLMARRSAVRS